MGRPGLSAWQKKEVWKRWKRGQSRNDIARALAKQRGSIHHVLTSSGGIEPPTRRRSRLALSLSEREEISRERGLFPSARTCHSVELSDVGPKRGLFLLLADRAIAERGNFNLWLWDKGWDPYRDDPRFQAILRRVGFPGS